MAYIRRPFNPLTPTINQVITELDQANENFDILAQAFVGNNPETYKVKDADTVDGFHASLTPAPNIIVPLNASGILDLSASYLRSNVYTFRRVDLTNATSDYELQVGEEAIIRFNNQQLIPLRIAVQSPSSPLNPTIYNIIIGIYWASSMGMIFQLSPNNTIYFDQIRNTVLHSAEYYIYEDGLDYYPEVRSDYSGRFLLQTFGGADDFPWFANLFAVYYGAQYRKLLCGSAFSEISVASFSGVWFNTITAWTSLGSFSIGRPTFKNISGIAVVRRLA